VYPPEAKEAKVQGEVKLSVGISADGSVDSITVLEGPELLQQAAVDAVNQWRFQPGMKDGQPVATTATISINFSLL
jgi:protein TonB